MRRLGVLSALSALFISSCTAIPALDEATGGIPVSEIVLRIKCELSDAFTNDLDINKPDMSWVRNWTAQIDLTLEILDTATFAPGASFMQPLHNGYSTAAGPSSISTSGVPGTTLSAVAQSFAVAAGASVNGQASRTQTLGFNMSLAELRRWRLSSDTERLCAISDNMDLRGRLGLKEWVTQAFQPVLTDRLLYAGYHPKPGSAPSGSSPAKTGASSKEQPAFSPPPPRDKACTARDTASIEKGLTDLDKAADTLRDASLVNVQTNIDKSATTEESDLKSANSDFDKEQDALKKTISQSAQYIPVLEPYVAKRLDTLAAYANKASTRQKAFSAASTKAIADARTNAQDAANKENLAKNEIDSARTALKAMQVNQDCSTLPRLLMNVQTATQNASSAVEASKDAKSAIASATQDIGEIKKLTKALTDYGNTFQTIDPPLSTVGQSVQFILNYSGNATPTWTFVNFKGPNNPLFSAAGTRTHMLNITLGSPTESAGTTNAALAQNQLYLLLNNRLPAAR